MNILITGAQGFIGKNLSLWLSEDNDFKVSVLLRGQEQSLQKMLLQADAIIHLAGENRPLQLDAYEKVNHQFTQKICNLLLNFKKNTPILFASSSQAVQNNPYGLSKRAAERALHKLSTENGNPVIVYRLPGVFGKWCKPNYNSVVATFCHNKVNNLPIHITDINTRVRLVYIDDVVSTIIKQLKKGWYGFQYQQVDPEYDISLGELSSQIDNFKKSNKSLVSERVGSGFVRALYATYLSHLTTDLFSYDLPVHQDNRGKFVEILKTIDSGQFSFFSCEPGLTRGGHYHHTKSEKFLVIQGKARFGFRNLITNERYYIEADGEKPKIVVTVPGWTHDITNIGGDNLLALLWANEIFNHDLPDTIQSKV